MPISIVTHSQTYHRRRTSANLASTSHATGWLDGTPVRLSRFASRCSCPPTAQANAPWGLECRRRASTRAFEVPVRAGAPSGHGHAVEPPSPPMGGSSKCARWPAPRRHPFSNCFGRIVRSLAVSPRPHPPLRPPRGAPSGRGRLLRCALRATRGAGLLRPRLALHLLAPGRRRLCFLRPGGSHRSGARRAAHFAAAPAALGGLRCACVVRASGAGTCQYV